jgi:glycosyltransferase involved in cell wall biosynthesis
VGQSYKNWRVVLIDDVSDQQEVVKEAEIITRWRTLCQPGMRDDNCNSQVRVFWNDEKQWEVANVLRGIATCEPDDIVCRLDGDDWLTDLDALAVLNAAYNQLKVDAIWTAHRWGFSDKNISGPMPVGSDPYRGHQWVSSHLKTFRRYLLQDVPYENFTNMNGEFVRRAGDQAIYLPCLHQAAKRNGWAYLPRVMYHYTIDEQGGAVYQTDDAKFQKLEAEFIRKRGFVTEGVSWEKHDMFIRNASRLG